MFDSLRRHLERFVSLTDEEFEIITTRFRYKKYRKHQYILQEGDISLYDYFILSGCTRTYEVDDKGQEHILQFGLQDWWVGDMYSFLAGKPSRVNIDCIEDTEALRINKADLEALYVQVPKMERYMRILIQNAYMAAIQRIYSNLSKPALDRYQEFLERYPLIEQRVPNHQIASYLGITPQSLSRLRSQGLRKTS